MRTVGLLHSSCLMVASSTKVSCGRNRARMRNTSGNWIGGLEDAFPPLRLPSRSISCSALSDEPCRWWSSGSAAFVPPRGKEWEEQLPSPLFESSPVALHCLRFRFVGHPENGDCGLPVTSFVGPCAEPVCERPWQRQLNVHTHLCGQQLMH